MGNLRHETREVQNPALGAALQWRFACGYAEGSGVAEPTPLPLLFIILPVLFHQDTAGVVSSTLKQSGLRLFADKFARSANSKSDLLLAIHDRILCMRVLSLESLRLAFSRRLVSLCAEHGTVIPLSCTQAKAGIPASVRGMLRNADKFGHWCSQVSLHEVSAILKVRF